MILASLNLGDKHKLEFGMKIAGTSNEPTSCRFIIQGSQFDITCKCIKEGELVQVDIPMLSTIIAPGVYKVRLETILHDRVFEPVNEEIEFKSAANAVVTSVSTGSTSRDIKPKSTLANNMPTLPTTVANVNPSIDVFSLYNGITESRKSPLTESETALIRAIEQSDAFANIAGFKATSCTINEYTDSLANVAISGISGKDKYIFETTIVNQNRLLPAETTYIKVSSGRSLLDYL